MDKSKIKWIAKWANKKGWNNENTTWNTNLYSENISRPSVEEKEEVSPTRSKMTVCYSHAKYTRFRVNLHSTVAWMSRNSLLQTGDISEVWCWIPLLPRNEIIEEMQWHKQPSGKKNEKEPKDIYIGNLSFDKYL